MIKYQVLAMLLAVVVGSFLLGNSAHAVDPDELRDRTRPAPPAATAEQVHTRGKADAESGPEALSAAFKKFSTMRMLAWKISGGGNLMIMGQFNSEKHCQEARKVLQRQVVRWGWGRAECLEYVTQ